MHAGVWQIHFFTNNFVIVSMINQHCNTLKIIVLVELTNLLFQYKNILAEGKLTWNNICFSNCITCMTSGTTGWQRTINLTIPLFNIGFELNDMCIF